MTTTADLKLRLKADFTDTEKGCKAACRRRRDLHVPRIFRGTQSKIVFFLFSLFTCLFVCLFICLLKLRLHREFVMILAIVLKDCLLKQ